MLVSSLTGPALASGAEPRAGAEPAARSAHLQWQRAVGAEGCISGEELAAALQRRLRRGTIGGPDADVTLEGTIAPAAGGAPGWKAWIVVRDRAGRPDGTREVASAEASCRALDEALLLVLSLIVDPSMAFDAAVPPPAEAVQQRRPDETVWHLAAGGRAAVGLLPGLGGGVGLGAGVRPWGGPVLEIEGAHWFGTQAQSEVGGATISATHGGVNVCWLPFERGRLALGACAGGQAGVLRATAEGFSGANLARSRLLANVTARAEARFTVAEPFFLRLALGAAVPLVRDRFFFDAQDGRQVSLFQPSSAAFVAGLEGGVTFR